MQPSSPQEPAVATFIVALIVSQMLTVFSYWISSMVVAREKGTLANAFRAWFMFLVIAAIAGLGVAAIIIWTGKNAVPIVLAAFLVGVLIPIIMVPMRVYGLGCGGTILFVIIQLVVSGILQGGVVFVAERWAPEALDDELTSKFWNRVDSELGRTAKSKPSTETPESLQLRRDELARRGEQLAIRKQYTSKNDPSAAAQYERDKAAYDRDAAKLKADEAASK